VIAYLESSVVLRIVLGSPGRFEDWVRCEWLVTSALTEVECLRSLDVMRVRRTMPDGDLVRRLTAVRECLRSAEVIEVSRAVLERASGPLPVALRTLDAIHLATALSWRGRHEKDLTMVTHDVDLGRAATAMNLAVVGV
jgi:predicted nucleic acid-binding protein